MLTHTGTKHFSTGMLPARLAGMHELGFLTEEKKKEKEKEEKSLTYMTIEQLQKNTFTFATSLTPKPYSLTAI